MIKLSDLYLVEFMRNAETRYGVVDQYSQEAKEAFLKGQVLVEDCVIPEAYTLPVDSVKPVKESGYRSGWSCGIFGSVRLLAAIRKSSTPIEIPTRLQTCASPTSRTPQ